METSNYHYRLPVVTLALLLVSLSLFGCTGTDAANATAVPATSTPVNGTNVTVNVTKPINATKAPAAKPKPTMTWRAILTLIVVILMLFCLTFKVMSVGAGMVGSATFLWVCTVIHSEDIFVGLTNSGVLSVGLMFIIVHPLAELGLMKRMIQLTLSGTGGVRWPLFKLCLLSLLISPFMETIPQTAMQVPLVKTFALEMGVAPSLFLMPMNFAILLANWAVIGSSNNLVCSGLMDSTYGKEMEFFEPIKVSGAPAIIGFIYLIIFAPLLLPQNKGGMFYLVKNRGQEFILQVRVSSSCTVKGKTIEEFSNEYPELASAVSLVELTRGKSQLTQFSGQEILQRGDILCFAGSVADVLENFSALGFDCGADMLKTSMVNTSVVVPPSTSNVQTPAVPPPSRSELASAKNGGAEVAPGMQTPTEPFGVDDVELTNQSFFEGHLRLHEPPKPPAPPASQSANPTPSNNATPGVPPPPVVAPTSTKTEPIDGFGVSNQSISKSQGLVPAAHSLDTTRLFEVVLAGFNAACGNSVDKALFRTRYGCAVLAVRTATGQHDLIGSKMMDHVLGNGDTLLIMGPSNFVTTWNGSPDFLTINSCGEALEEHPEEIHTFTVPHWFPFGTPITTAPKSSKIIVAPFWYPYLTALAFAGAIAGAIAGYALYETTLLAVCFMVLVGIIDTYKAIALVDWNAWIIVAFSFGIGKAVSKSGLAAVIGQGIVDSHIEGFPLLLVISLISATMANIVTNKAAIQILFPIVAAIYKSNGKNPLPGIMVMCAMSLMPMCTPYGIAANILIVGPGGYSPLDFLKFGTALNIMMAVLHPLDAAIVYDAW